MALMTPAKSGAAAAEITEAQLKGGKTDIAGLVMLVVLLFCTLLTLLILGILLTEVVTDAWPIMSDRPGDFLTTTIGSDPSTTGVWPGLYGSFIIGLGVMLLAVPLGVAAAIYLEDYARHDHKLTQLILVNIRNLAGVPAVIYGVLGLTIFGTWLKGLTGGSSVISAALTMAILVLPVVIITSMEAIRAVPQGLREGGYGVGSSRWEVTRDHVIPYAAPGILTGIVLSIARALGEAAPLIMLGAITGLLPEPTLTGNFTALPMLIYNWSGRPDSGGGEVGWTNAAASAGLVLLVLVILFNAVAIYLRNRFERTRAGV
jgi:phosphate transport system permease protein